MVRVVLGDITELEVDAIVNAANSQLMVGGGVDYAIHQAAGPGLKNEIDSQAKYLNPGEVLLTSGYRLPAKYVIHTVAPRWSGGDDAEFDVLFTCYAECIGLALKKGLSSIAFPALGTGAFGVPVEVSAEAAVRAIAEFDLSDEFEVILCCYSQDDYETYTSTIQRILYEAKQERKLPDCAICFWPLMPIVYGMLAPSDKDDFIAGGCSIMPGAPQIGCKNCGWEGENSNSEDSREIMTFAVLDQEKKRFAGGVGYKVGRPDSPWTIVPGSPEYGVRTLHEMREEWSKIEGKSLWLAKEGDLMGDTVGNLVSRRYADVTPEVMEFAGFSRVRDFPRFEERT
jgi:O-acetyl-ADP-ribose deacetylase (regulator of RNase III)